MWAHGNNWSRKEFQLQGERTQIHEAYVALITVAITKYKTH